MSLAVIMCSSDNSTLAPWTRSLLDVERNFDLCGMYTWQSNNWKAVYGFIGVYLAAILGGRKYMESREPFKLRWSLFLWNVLLAVFSIVAASRMVTAIWYMMSTYGFLTSVCSKDPLELRQSVGIWIFYFMMSKIVEFGDTAFIVLRKTRLMLLHWYHHVTVAFMVWATGAYASPIHIHFCAFNVFVHSFMYSYYALKVLGIRIPKRVSMAITALQLLQMVVGVFITLYAYWAKARYPSCCAPGPAIAIAGAIYMSYFILFLKFFIQAYFARKPDRMGNGVAKKLK